MRRLARTPSRAPSRAAERGTVLLMATITILVVVGMLALAVDVGYLMSGRGQLQNIVDAAALAGAQGLRVAIEPSGARSEQETLVRRFARDMANFNPMRRADGSNAVALADTDVIIEYPPDYPVQAARVIVKHRLPLPTIFGNIFGISSMNIGSVAIASTTVVDGGTGVVSGCWRPILMPDTFYDANNVVWAISGPASFSDGSISPSRRTGPGDRDPALALQDGDHYISRFASDNLNSTRNESYNFVQRWPSGTPVGEATSIRDAYSQSELKYVNGVLTGRNLIGQRMLLRPDDWRIVNFEASGITGSFPSDPVEQVNQGVCTPIQVGRLVQVYTPDQIGLYQNFTMRLLQLRNTPYVTDIATTSAREYRYAQTHNFPTPNANPRVIPVLLCSPVQFSVSRATPQFYVTNFGAFFLERVDTNGTLIGYFVREVVTGGMPLQPENHVSNSGLLPVSVQLVR